MKPIYAAAISLLAVTACNRSDGDGGTGSGNMAVDTVESENSAAIDTNSMAAVPGDAGTTTDPATYVQMAGAADMFEIESSRAILQKTKNADVRAFANMMIDEHTKSTAKVKQAAASQNVTAAAPQLMPDQQRMLDEIKRLIPLRFPHREQFERGGTVRSLLRPQAAKLLLQQRFFIR